MPSPFPGMNPYLENPELWSEVHHRLITAIADAIEPDLSRRYRIAIEKRIYWSEEDESVLVGIPDATIYTQSVAAKSQATATLTVDQGVTVQVPAPETVREAYLEIREVETGYVVTTIEVLSPKNKRAGVGRKKYETKRSRILGSPTHLVEIDLLRMGKPMSLLGQVPQTDYRILVSRGDCRPQAQLHGFSVRQEIPRFLIPLQLEDQAPLLNLQDLLAGVYDRARLEMVIDYRLEAVPPLREGDRLWAEALLEEKGLR